MPQRYLDDFKPGEVFKSNPQTLSKKHFSAFAEMTGDAHPIHYDVDYARAKGWDAPLAHGLLLLGLCDEMFLGGRRLPRWVNSAVSSVLPALPQLP